MSILANEMNISQIKEILKDGRTMCFTGRRPKDLCGYSRDAYMPLVQFLTEILYRRYYKELGVRCFISGGAQGFDQLAFWSVERMKSAYKTHDVKNIVFAVKGQSARWKDTGTFSKHEYELMLSKADAMCWVSGGSIQALLDRNHIMVDHSERLLALYPDDSWDTSKGGTAETLRYAQKASHMKDICRIGYTLEKDGLRPAGLWMLREAQKQ